MTPKKWILLALVFSLQSPVGAVGIAMRFVDVTMEYVEPGASFNLRASRNLPLVVINQDADQTAEIVIEAVSPNAKEMKDGYDPIPDPSWISAVPNRFVLGPKASASADVLVHIPNDPKLIGHNYEVILWVHTEHRNRAEDGGVVIQAGLRSRFRLSIGTQGPASLQREKALKKLATINTNFSVNPDNLFVQNVEVGKDIDLKAEKRASLKVVNQGDDPVSLKVHAASADPNITPQSDYEFAPDPSWLTVSPGILTIPGNSIKEVKLRLKIPDKPEYRGKKWLFLIQTTLADDSLPLLYDNMLYVNTLP